MYQVGMNRFDLVQSLDVKTGTEPLYDNTPPLNIHGDKVFMVKLQAPMGGSMPDNILIYDRQRSFQVYLMTPMHIAML